MEKEKSQRTELLGHPILNAGTRDGLHRDLRGTPVRSEQRSSDQKKRKGEGEPVSGRQNKHRNRKGPGRSSGKKNRPDLLTLPTTIESGLPEEWQESAQRQGGKGVAVVCEKKT